MNISADGKLVLLNNEAFVLVRQTFRGATYRGHGYFD
jgi:hypothetical protein